MNNRICRIVIEAFRGYDAKQIFDLTTATNQPASLVVLYAPNGFGKTSFFDAVEWALTGKIKRFADNAVIQKSAERQRGRILHNYDSPQASGSVEIQFETQGTLTRSTKFSKPGSAKWDYNKGKLTDNSNLLPKGKQAGLSTVSILTQESGDQAVCFTTPEGRFDALKSFWDTHNDTNIYKSILGIHKVAREREAVLTADIADLEKLLAEEVNEAGVGQRLQTLIDSYNSEALDEIDSVGEQLNLPRLTILHEKALTCKNKANEDTAILRDKLEKITFLLAGYSSYTGKLSYLSALTEEYNQVESRLQTIRQLAEHRKKAEHLTRELQRETHNLNQKYNLKYIIQDYLLIDEDIQTLLAYSSEATANLKKERQVLTTLSNSTLKLTARLRELKKSVDTGEGTSRQLAQAQETYFSQVRKASSLAARLEIARRLVSRRNQAHEQQLTTASDLQDFLKITRALAEQPALPVPAVLGHPFGVVKLAAARVREAELLLQQAELASTHAQGLQATLVNLLRLGKHLTEETQATECPLCTSKFTDYQALLTAIESQAARSPTTTEAIAQVVSAKQQLATASEAFASSVDDFHASSQPLFLKARVALQRSRQKLAASETLVYHYQTLLDLVTRDLSELAATVGLSTDALTTEDWESLRAARQAEYSRVRDHYSKLSREVEDKERQQDELRQSLLQKESELEQTRLQITNAQASPIYRQALLLIDELGSLSRGLVDLDVHIAAAEATIHSIELAAAAARATTAKLAPLVASLSEPQLTEEQQATARLRSGVSTEISTYLDAVSSLRLGEVDDLPIALHAAQQATEKTLTLLERQLTLLSSIIATVELTRSRVENAKNLNYKRQQLAKVQGKIKQLQQAKQHAISYIKQKIAVHFDEELINDIYQKIEPHPTLKHIKFVPDLEGTKPGLDILVSDAINGHDKAPVIYFSAAQVNILSLSIFLAKAIRDETTVVNTIFLDDPIQFLDSINMLSFIDLVRTIMIDKKLNRQLFISTHDENFFKLLQKKIDPAHYESKFIELSTFGRIKTPHRDGAPDGRLA